MVRNAISTDGSRVIWSGRQNPSLYLRDMVREETVSWVARTPNSKTASSEDTRVFYTGAGDLYVFEAPGGSKR